MPGEQDVPKGKTGWTDSPNPEGVVWNLPYRFRSMRSSAQELLEVVCRERATATDAIAAAKPHDWRAAGRRLNTVLDVTRGYYDVVAREMELAGTAVQELIQLAHETELSLRFGKMTGGSWPEETPTGKASGAEEIKAGFEPIDLKKRKTLAREIKRHVRIAVTKITPRLREDVGVYDFVFELLNVGGQPKLREHEIEALREFVNAPSGDSLTAKWEKRKIRELLGEVSTQNTSPPVCQSKAVKLFGPGEQPEVYGKKKPTLTKARYNSVKALIEAGEMGLTKDELVKNSNHTDAVNCLKRLAKKDRDWKRVLQFAGQTGKRHRIK